MYKSNFKKKLIASAVASAALASMGQFALAQDDPALEEVVVTGIRASLDRSMDVKRESAGVVDAISAEDIGKFPDSNLAESLQRITGVSIDRANGEGFQVTVRGFGPQYNLITLNGRSMPAGQLNPEGGLINQRSFDMSNIASEGVSGVEVYKTGRASISSGGIGATVNIKTSRPMDTEGVVATFGAKALYDTTNVAGNAVTPEVSGLFSWSNDMFGASVSASYQERDSMNAGLRPNIGNGWNNQSGLYVPPVDGAGGSDGSTANGLIRDADGNITTVIENAPSAGTLTNFPNGPSFYRADHTRTRENAQVALQYRPMDNLTATLDYTTAEQESTMIRSGTSFWFGGTFPTKAVRYTEEGGAASPILWWSENQANGQNHSTPEPRDVALGIQQVHVQNNLESIGLNVDWEVNDRLSLSFDGHNSSTESLPGDGSKFNNVNAGIGYQGNYAQGLDFTGDLPLLVGLIVDDYPGIATGGANPGVVEIDDLSSTVSQINFDRIWVDIDQYKFEGTFALSENIGIDFGVEKTEFESIQKSMGTQNISMLGNWGAANPGDIPAGLIHEIDYADYFDDYDTTLSADSQAFFGAGAEVLTQGFMSSDASAIAESMFADAGLVYGVDGRPDSINRSLTEDITAIYVQGDMHFDVGGMPLDILAGLRYEETDVTSTAVISATTLTWQGDNDFGSSAGDPATAPTIIADYSYDHVLPAIDVSLGITEDIVGRASYSTTIARADYDQLSQGLSGIGGPVGGPTILGGTPGGATSGSVSIDPIESDNFDVSIEWYYADASYVSLGAFYKDVPNFIGTATTQVTAENTRDPSNGPRAQRAIADLNALGEPITQQNLFEMVVSYDEGCQPGATFNACGAAYGSLPYNGLEGIENGADIIALPDDPLSTLNANFTANANDATLSGLEIAAQHFFGDSGFGVSANYTFVDGSVEFDNTLISTATQFALVGLSDSANLAVMYEKDGWQARAAYNWRDQFLYSANVGSNEPGYTDEYAQLDFNVGYNFSDNFSIALEGLNILGEDRRTRGRNSHQTLDLQIFKPRYALSGRYTF